MNNDDRLKFDALVIGGGIAGEEAALNMADQGCKVLIVDKDLSIGGKMIHLSKVFPTLDCGACITTPKVSETVRHPNISIYTNTEIKNITGLNGKGFEVLIEKKPRYVKADLCTGCQICEEKCPVIVEDQYQWNLVGRKAVYVPFSIASPRIAAIDIENCILCGVCEKVCQADAIDFSQESEEYLLNVKTVLFATGFQLFDSDIIERYNSKSFHNIVTSMQMERQLVPTRPYNNVLRPGDGKMPDNIAYVLCTGSRDTTVGNPICSQVCCMYSIKQAQLLMGALPMADVTIYYLHIRAFGKGFEEFYQQARSMGIEFIKGKIGKISEKEDKNLILKYEDIESGKLKEAEHDLVVLSVGILPDTIPKELFTNAELLHDEFNFIKQTDELSNPAKTSIDGVFVAGTASGPMDIPDSILSAGAASSEAISYLNKNQ
jgi:heterodisulfide reductase subunit A